MEKPEFIITFPQLLVLNLSKSTSWLLKEIMDTTDSRFNQLNNGVDALQAALFMVGYDVLWVADRQAVFVKAPTNAQNDTL